MAIPGKPSARNEMEAGQTQASTSKIAKGTYGMLMES